MGAKPAEIFSATLNALIQSLALTVKIETASATGNLVLFSQLVHPHLLLHCLRPHLMLVKILPLRFPSQFLMVDVNVALLYLASFLRYLERPHVNVNAPSHGLNANQVRSTIPPHVDVNAPFHDLNANLDRHTTPRHVSVSAPTEAI